MRLSNPYLDAAAWFLGQCACACGFILLRLLAPALVLACVLWLVLAQCRAQDVWRDGDPRENHAAAPEFRGVPANAPLPAEMHLRNTVGTDGAGLCVPSSLTINGRYQAVPGIESILELARQRPGGYSPDKLAALLRETVPDEKYASYVGTDPSVLAKLSAEGYPIGATMNTGALYGYRPIHHMISLAHFDPKANLACVVDNNQPGVFNWMRASEFGRRWIDGGTGWAFVWLRRAKREGRELAALVIVVAALAFASWRASRPEPPSPLDPEESDDER